MLFLHMRYANSVQGYVKSLTLFSFAEGCGLAAILEDPTPTLHFFFERKKSRTAASFTYGQRL